MGPGSRFAVWGHSQGGHAALYTGLLARSYAPELRLVGVAAAAPATELATLLNNDLHTIDGKKLAAISLYSWARVFGAQIDRVVYPGAMPTLNQLSQECIESISDILDRYQTERPLRRRFLSVKNLASIEPYRSLLARNTPGTLSPDIPILIAQGLADTLVLPPVTKDYVTRLCRAGSRVKYLLWQISGMRPPRSPVRRSPWTGWQTALPDVPRPAIAISRSSRRVSSYSITLSARSTRRAGIS